MAGVGVHPVNRRPRRQSSPREQMRVLALGAVLLLVTGVAAVSAAIASGTGSWWALAAFALIGAAGVGWRVRVQAEAVRASDPSEGLTRRDLLKYGAVAVGIVLVVVAAAAIASAVR